MDGSLRHSNAVVNSLAAITPDVYCPPLGSFCRVKEFALTTFESGRVQSWKMRKIFNLLGVVLMQSRQTEEKKKLEEKAVQIFVYGDFHVHLTGNETRYVRLMPI